ncbi:NAD(P)/FAD-dependent oxidoreductase [Aureimonas frigidaquae]|uniref:FAD dependent oxidoreductase n=1 Tax=Aureimonas frigidaquae TaxID=424757 RepID=A0A0P0Z425_9HYPH|nr:FAD-binding oxidoreductase [Aureimonas frigidaquae]BAT28570.1 FAD dependent oxidoreductase [Aureimonas frigidaquae]
MSQHMQSFETVIVGGGIYGASLAYELSSLGRQVLLLEAGEIASGASGGPGERGVRANNRDIRELPVVSLSIDRWQEFQDAFEGGVGYRRVGGLQVFDQPYGLREHEIRGRLEARAAIQTALGTPTRILTRDEVVEIEPEMTRSIIGGVYCPNDGVGDHTFATRQFAKAAEAKGATIRTGARVVKLNAANGRIRSISLADGEEIGVGDKIFLLANAGAPALLAEHIAGELLPPTWNLMPQMMYVTNPENRTIKHLLSHAHRRLAIKQLPDGTIMLSGGVSVTHKEGRVDTGSLSSTAINLTDSIMTLPFLDRSQFMQVDATRVDTNALDDIPIIDNPAHLPNLFYGYAWSGHGFAISLGFTKLFADWSQTGEKPELLEPFSPARFHLPAPVKAAPRRMALSA